MTRWALPAGLLLAGCAQPHPSPCADTLSAQLLFGNGNDPGFSAFLDESVTSRFPAGLTVLDATGRWRAPDGRQVREASRIVLLVVPAHPDPRPALDAIRDEYRRRFHQQSVGLLLAPTCASF